MNLRVMLHYWIMTQATDAWHASRYKSLECLQKKSTSTVSISNGCNSLPFLHAQMPATAIIFESADYHHYRAVYSLHTVSWSQNADPQAITLVRHDSLNSTKKSIFMVCIGSCMARDTLCQMSGMSITKKRPCCLCLLFQPLSEEPHYTKTTIYLPLHGWYKGEWVMECASGRCRYLGGSSFSQETTCSYITPPSASGESLLQIWATGEKIPS